MKWQNTENSVNLSSLCRQHSGCQCTDSILVSKPWHPDTWGLPKTYPMRHGTYTLMFGRGWRSWLQNQLSADSGALWTSMQEVQLNSCTAAWTNGGCNGCVEIFFSPGGSVYRCHRFDLMGKQTMVTCPVDQGFTQKIDQLPAYLGIMFHRRAEVPSRLAPLKPTANCFRGSEREANLSRKCWKQINQQVSAPEPLEKLRSHFQSRPKFLKFLMLMFRESPDMSRFIPSKAT